MWRALSLGRPFGWQEGLERPESAVGNFPCSTWYDDGAVVNIGAEP